MLQQRNLDATDSELMKKVADFGARHAPNGVYIGQFYSKSQSAPVLIVVALGEQALQVQQILMSAAVPDEAAIVQAANKRGF